MRKIIVLGVVCLWASGLWAGGKAKPLNIKTGLWQTRSTTTVNGSMGIPPEMAARLTPAQRARFEAAMKKHANGVPRSRTYKNCLTEKQLTEDPFTDKDNNMKCQETVIKSTASDLDVREACTDGSSKSDVHMVIHASSREHVTSSGNVTATMGGHTMHSVIKMDSRWVGTACPAGTH
ncbi:MAG: DUF3617 domain-containing protein [Actinomycetota bacterium]